MRCGELLKCEASEAEIRERLVAGDTSVVTLRIPAALRDAAKDEAATRGMSFSAYVRMCMLDELTSGR